MSQNRSTAVMQRRGEAPDALDFFPTPPWATRALCEHLSQSLNLTRQDVWEPACGEGHMARPLAEYFRDVYASDVHDYGSAEQHDRCDFAIGWDWPEAVTSQEFHWIITNPPFRLASEFIWKAFGTARTGVAMLVRSAFLEGGGRYRDIFEPTPPFEILQFCERVPMLKGRLDRKAASATAYCWLVWRVDQPVTAPAFRWLPPCRKRLERDSDYVEAPA